MKTKDKQKALAFIAKYQLGGYTDDYQIQNPYQYDPNLQVAQQNQILSPSTSTVQLNQLNSAKSQMGYQPKADLLDKAIPFISPAINLGIGVANIFSSIKEKSRQKAYERAFRKDLERRQTDQRFNDFYATPYSVSSGSTRSGAPGYQLGGQTNQPNQMELFLDYYNTQENNSDLLDQQFQKYYNDRNDQMEQSWKSKRQSGFSSLLKGAGDLLPLFQEGGNTNQVDTLKTKIKDIEMEKAKALVKMSGKDSTLFKDLQKTVRGANPEDLKTGFKSKRFGDRFREHQDGGEIDILNPVIDPTQDLYSPEYKVPTEVEDEVSQVQIETSQEDAITQWLFEDIEEDPYKEEVTDQYLESFEGGSDVIDQIGQQESGGNYEAVNPYSSARGKFQFTQVWTPQIKSFMGLPEHFNKDQVMQAFMKSPQSQEKFMQYVTNTIYKPEVEKLRPLAKQFGLDDNKLIRMLHYRGIGDTRRRLQTGDFEVSQSEKAQYKNPDILEYLNK